jgi:3-oxoadipate enol-lactonase
MSTVDARTGTLSWEVSDSPGDHGLLLIHSLGADTRMWVEQLPFFAEVRRVVAPDLPGHGRSGANDRDYSIEDLGQDMIDIADAAGFDTFDVCGISLGGMIAMWLAVNHPQRVTRLVACNTAAKIGTESSWNERIEAVREGGMESIRDAVIPRFVTPELAGTRPHVMDQIHAMFDSIDPIGYAGCCAALRDGDLRDSVAQIACPTLIIAGDRDISTTPEMVRELHDSIPASRMELLADAAHLSNLDQPAEFTRVVLGALG